MSQQPQTGKKIENYVFNYSDFLGSGNFSKCYKATDINTQEKVAIKIVELNTLKSKKLEQLLYSQIAVLKQLNHPNVLRCLEVFTSNRNCYIITQICNEGDLENKIKKEGCFDELKAQKIIADVYEGLQYLSSKGIVHRDIKIANIFMNDGVAKIADFGFAVYAQTTFKDLNIGSPLYMSPEGFLTNTYGPKTDVWAFGIMIYQLFHDRTPFSRCVTEKQLKISIMTPIQISSLKASIPTSIKSLILNCLQISEQKRPLIKDLKNTPYLQSILNKRSNQIQTTFKLTSPPKLQIGRSAQESNTIGRSKNNERIQNIFMSEEHSRRFTSPPKAMTKHVHPTINNSLELNTHNRNQNSQQNITSNTINFNFQSPQLKRNKAFPAEAYRSANSSLKFTHEPAQSVLVESVRKNQKAIVSNQTPRLIDVELNFKESVSILHYCRLIFKYLQIYRSLTNLRDLNSQRHHSFFGTFLLSILEEVYRQIVNKKVRYEGQNPQIRERKLTEVTSQYLRKYSQQLKQTSTKNCISESQKKSISVTKFKEMAEMAVSKALVMETCTNDQAIAGELLLTIYSSTILLQFSCKKKNFGQFQKNRDIQDTLNRNKLHFTFSSYLSHRNKVFGTIPH